MSGATGGLTSEGAAHPDVLRPILLNLGMDDESATQYLNGTKSAHFTKAERQLASDWPERLRAIDGDLSKTERSRVLDALLQELHRRRQAAISGPSEPKLLGAMLIALLDPSQPLEVGGPALVASKKFGATTWAQPRTSYPPLLLVFDEAGSFAKTPPKQATGLERAREFITVEQPRLDAVIVVTPVGPPEWETGIEISHLFFKEDDALGEAVKSGLGDGGRLNGPPLASAQLIPLKGGKKPQIPPVREDVQRVTELSSVDLASLVRQFDAQLSRDGVVCEPSTQLALLAGFLSSQFLLLAGPSGTGKSTLARALLEFFVPPDSQAILEGRRQLIGPEDVVGFMSAITGVYAPGLEFESLWALSGAGESSPTPAILVEEINLSPVEGYLAPLVHGLSGASAQAVVWRIGPEGGSSEYPGSLEFAPYPRLLGTINVDATAPAPSPKVAARACVILLEPSLVTRVEEVRAAAERAGEPEEGQGAPPPPPPAVDPASFVGDPFLAARQLDEHQLEELVSGITSTLDRMGARSEPPESSEDPNIPITYRQMDQFARYVAWFVLLADAAALAEEKAPDPAVYAVAAENAILHFVLPTLSPTDFSLALNHLHEVRGELHPPAPPGGLGSMLPSRVERLRDAGGSDFVGRALDFWDRLS
jgi:energy-coupling factor transporter ATP-binding protein EcfA2